MEISVLAYQTQLEILAEMGSVRKAKDYHCICLPDQPDWYWGTFMVRACPPVPGVRATWEADFRTATHLTRHYSFAWNQADTPPVLDEFIEAGYTVHHSVTYVLDQLPTGKQPARQPEIRQLVDDRDWQAATALQVRVDQEKYVGGRGAYKERQMAAYQKLCAQGKGAWWGAWADGKLVGDLGVFPVGQRRARLQQVETHPDYRRQGVCSWLLRSVAQAAFSTGRIDQLVIVADAASPGASVYGSAHCREVERTIELSKSCGA